MGAPAFCRFGNIPDKAKDRHPRIAICPQQRANPRSGGGSNSIDSGGPDVAMMGGGGGGVSSLYIIEGAGAAAC